MSHIEQTLLYDFHKFFNGLVFFFSRLGYLSESPHSNHGAYLTLDGKSRDTTFLDSSAGPDIPPSEIFIDGRWGLGASSQLGLGLEPGDSESL